MRARDEREVLRHGERVVEKDGVELARDRGEALARARDRDEARAGPPAARSLDEHALADESRVAPAIAVVVGTVTTVDLPVATTTRICIFLVALA